MKIKLSILILILFSYLSAMGRTPAISKGFIDRYFSRPDTNYSIILNEQDQHSAQLLSSRESLQEFNSLCSKKKYPVKNIYLEITNYQLFKNEIINFLEITHKNSIKTYFVITPLHTSANIELFSEGIENFISFNNTLPNSFTGIHINYEPSANYQATANLLVERELTLLAKLNELKKRTKLELSSLLPSELGNSQLTEKYLPKLFNYLNSVVIYQPDLSPEKENLLLSYAEEIKTEFVIAPYLKSSKIHGFKNYLTELEEVQKKYKMFNSLALTYSDFKKLNESEL